MIYLKLFLEFLEVGAFSFGGGYTSIPLIRDIVINNNWLNYDTYIDLVAIAEATPGPIMVNIATYVGCQQGGALGGAIALLGSILPAFLILLIFAIAFSHFANNKKVNYVFDILRPAIVGIIFASGLELLIRSLNDKSNIVLFIKNTVENIRLNNFTDELAKILIMFLIIFIMYIYKRLTNKKFGSIKMICLAAFLGIVVFSAID